MSDNCCMEALLTNGDRHDPNCIHNSYFDGEAAASQALWNAGKETLRESMNREIDSKILCGDAGKAHMATNPPPKIVAGQIYAQPVVEYSVVLNVPGMDPVKITDGAEPGAYNDLPIAAKTYARLLLLQALSTFMSEEEAAEAGLMPDQMEATVSGVEAPTTPNRPKIKKKSVKRDA